MIITPDIPDTLQEIRIYLAAALGPDYQHYRLLCVCGHAAIWHGYYHDTGDGDWVECKPVCGVSRCSRATPACEVCECSEYELREDCECLPYFANTQILVATP